MIGFSLFTGCAEAIDSSAVLPLENLSGDPDQEYFSDGITDALINELAKISALWMISRTSVMQYKAAKKSLPEIARPCNKFTPVYLKSFIWAYIIDGKSVMNLYGEWMKDDLILEFWKEISEYPNRSRKICLRWEKEFGLPIHHLDGTPKARVFAYRDELDRWMEEVLNRKPIPSKEITVTFWLRKLLIPASLIIVLIIVLLILWHPWSLADPSESFLVVI